MENGYDLFLFMGQSNMAGRGVTNEKWQQKAPKLIDGAGMEFRAISDPTKLYEIEEPFGVYENNPNGIYEPDKKTGSMVTAFVNAYYEKTNRRILAVSASKGGSVIESWQGKQDYLFDALERLKLTENFCKEQDIKINHKYVVWCQGESNGDAGTSSEEYKSKFQHLQSQLKEAGIEHIFLIAIGKYNGEKETDYSVIHDTQLEIARENEMVTLVSDSFQHMKERGLMKDAFHYFQQAYNEVGVEAGAAAGVYVLANGSKDRKKEQT